MTSGKLPFQTSRLLLRHFDRTDLEAIMAYQALPEVQRYLDGKVRDRTELKAALEALRNQKGLRRPGDTIALAIERRADGVLIGHISLRWHDATAAQAELRIVLNPAYRRQGFGREAVTGALTLGFEEFGFHRIFARCDARSASAAGLLKGLGMRLEAHFREHALFQGEWDEELHFAILDREWQRSAKVQQLPVHRVA